MKSIASFPWVACSRSTHSACWALVARQAWCTLLQVRLPWIVLVGHTGEAAALSSAFAMAVPTPRSLRVVNQSRKTAMQPVITTHLMYITKVSGICAHLSRSVPASWFHQGSLMTYSVNKGPPSHSLKPTESSTNRTKSLISKARPLSCERRDSLLACNPVLDLLPTSPA